MAKCSKVHMATTLKTSSSDRHSDQQASVFSFKNMRIQSKVQALKPRIKPTQLALAKSNSSITNNNNNNSIG